MKSEIGNRRFLLFLLRVLIVAAVAVGIVVSVNYFVDASHVITSRTHEDMARLAVEGKTVAVPENYNERHFQLAVVNHMKTLPETVVVGTSRGMYLGEEITGFTDIYNSCISGACLEDCYAVLGLYRQKFSRFPSRVILEISPWLFNGEIEEDRWTEIYTYRTAAERLYTELNGVAPEINAVEWTPFGSDEKPFYSSENPWFSLAYFQYNCYMIRKKGLDAFREEPAHESTDPSEPADYPDGTVRNAASKEEESGERLAEVRSASGPVTFQNAQEMAEPDAGKMQAFELLVRSLLDRGSEVIFYLQPFSETQCRLSFDENMNPAFPLVETYLREFAAGCGIPVVGSYDVRNYGLTDERFIDSLHLDRQGTKYVWDTDYLPQASSRNSQRFPIQLLRYSASSAKE